MTDLVYKEECYRIVNCFFDVFNAFGYGLREQAYQKAVEEVLAKKGIKFQSELNVPLKIDGEVVGKYRLDLLIDNKIAVEIKTGNHFHKRDIAQLYSYLRAKNLSLGILINITSNGVEFKRIVNLR